MKKYYILLLATFLAFLSTYCSEDTKINNQPANALLIIDCEGDFRDDSVSVALNGTELIRGRIRTNWSIDLAWSSGLLTKDEGIYKLSVSMPDLALSDEYSFSLKDTLDLTVNYIRDSSKIKFREYKKLLLRD